MLARREVYWTNKALCGSLASLTETASLAARTNRRVFCMPPTVAVPENSADRLSERPISAVFTGGLTYQPNVDALRSYAEKVLPAFAQLGVEPPQLSIIGLCPDALKARLDHPTIRFLGYVSDINEELRRHEVFFAPIVSGSGIKTKVLEAMACGLPVIALPDGKRYFGEAYAALPGRRRAGRIRSILFAASERSGICRAPWQGWSRTCDGSYSIEAATGSSVPNWLPF